MMSSDTDTEPLFSRETFSNFLNNGELGEVWTSFSDGLLDQDAPALDCQELLPDQFGYLPALRNQDSNNLAVMPDEPMAEADLQPVVSQPSPSNGIPVTDSWPGEHQFSVTVRMPVAAGRQVPYVYSVSSAKLYTDVMVAVPFRFSVAAAGQQPRALRIRALPVYMDAHNIHEPVRRCPTHREACHEYNTGETELHHVIRAEHPNVSYKTVGERRSVTVPYVLPEPGTEDYTVSFKFACLNTCVGGINRRRLAVIFTLEDRSSGQVVGRQSVEVKVCRCPHRDWRTDEKRRVSNTAAEKPAKAAKRPRTASPARTLVRAPGIRGQQLVVEADDEEMYQYLLDQRELLRRLRQRRQEREEVQLPDQVQAPPPLTRLPTLKIEHIQFE